MDQVKRLVIFAILMENGKGILAKSPEYIQDKYNSAMNVRFPQYLLDVENHMKLGKYLRRWENHLKAESKEVTP